MIDWNIPKLFWTEEQRYQAFKQRLMDEVVAETTKMVTNKHPNPHYPLVDKQNPGGPGP